MTLLGDIIPPFLCPLTSRCLQLWKGSWHVNRLQSAAPAARMFTGLLMLSIAEAWTSRSASSLLSTVRFFLFFLLQGFWWFDAQEKPDSWCFLYWLLTTPTLLCHVTARKYVNNLCCKNNIVLFISLSRSSLSGNEPWWLQRRRGLHRHHRWTRHRGESRSRKSVTHLLWPITH